MSKEERILRYLRLRTKIHLNDVVYFPFPIYGRGKTIGYSLQMFLLDIYNMPFSESEQMVNDYNQMIHDISAKNMKEYHQECLNQNEDEKNRRF